MGVATDRIDNEIRERTMFRTTFDNADSACVLAWILNECGFGATDADAVRPELVALGNRLLAKMGVIHAANFVVMAEKLLEAANDEDLQKMRQEAAREREGEC